MVSGNFKKPALKNLAKKFGIDLIYLFGSQAEKGKSYEPTLSERGY